jgi:hypothetical protein
MLSCSGNPCNNDGDCHYCSKADGKGDNEMQELLLKALHQAYLKGSGDMARIIFLHLDKINKQKRIMKGKLTMDWDTVMYIDGKNLDDILPEDWEEGDIVEFIYRVIEKKKG